MLPVRRQHPRHLASEQLGGETGVVADHRAPAIPLEVPGHPLGDGANPLVGEVIGDDGAPPVGPEGDGRCHGGDSEPRCPDGGAASHSDAQRPTGGDAGPPDRVGLRGWPRPSEPGDRRGPSPAPRAIASASRPSHVRKAPPTAPARPGASSRKRRGSMHSSSRRSSSPPLPARHVHAGVEEPFRSTRHACRGRSGRSGHAPPRPGRAPPAGPLPGRKSAMGGAPAAAPRPCGWHG